MTNDLQDVVHGRFPHLHEAAKVPISKEARNEQIQLKADLSEIIRRQKEQLNEMRRLGPDATTFVTEEDYVYYTCMVPWIQTPQPLPQLLVRLLLLALLLKILADLMLKMISGE